MLKVLIADDSMTYRLVLKKILRSFENVEICGAVANGRAALREVDTCQPDLLLLDIEMPVMDGISVMKALKDKADVPDIIMCSALTTDGADVTIKALELGACDFITKPEGQTQQDSERLLKNQLAEKMATLLFKHSKSPQTKNNPIETKLRRMAHDKPEIIALGISTGGPKALSLLLPKLPGDFTVPIVIVQHMPTLFIQSLAESLNKKCKMKVKVAIDSEPLIPGTIYFAPGQKQMKVIRIKKRLTASLTDDPPEEFCQPSVNYLFRSVAETCQNKAIGVIMTGMGKDGTQGLKSMYQNGAFTIAQDADSSTIYGMPQEAFKANIVDQVLPLNMIAAKLVQHISQLS